MGKKFKWYLEKNGKVNIIVMGDSAGSAILEIFENIESKLKREHEQLTGWGNTETWFYKNEQGNVKMCCLPHLSRYGIFDRTIEDTEKQQQYRELEKEIKRFFDTK